jgi:hypothetical protein
MYNILNFIINNLNYFGKLLFLLTKLFNTMEDLYEIKTYKK